MKNLKKHIVMFFVLITSVVFAQPSSQNNEIRETANKGKLDLIKILSENKIFNFGVNARDLEGTETGNPIEEFTGVFKNLIGNDVTNINAIILRNDKYIVPITKGGQVITSITVAATNKGNKAVELVSKQYTTELNALPREIKGNNFKGLRIIVVQNLDAVLYVIDDKCYTSYNGRNVNEASNVSEILLQIQNDARAFEEKFGEQLRKGKLVR